MNDIIALVTVDDVIIDAIDWARDCLGTDRKISNDAAWRYVDRHYPGGWDAFAREMSVAVQL